MTLFVGTYGIQFQFGVGFDMSAFTALELTLTKPDDSTIVVTNPEVALGATDVETTVGLFLANEYVTYTFTIGQLDQAGSWHVRLKYTDATPRELFSKLGRFVVCSLGD